MIKRFFRWVFKEELAKLELSISDNGDLRNRLESVIGNMDVGVDVNQYSPSWAVVSIQGVKTDYIRFINLSQGEATDIQRFLSNFRDDRRVKVDAPMQMQGRIKHGRKHFW